LINTEATGLPLYPLFVRRFLKSGPIASNRDHEG
jgi:hypothetical protein